MHVSSNLVYRAAVIGAGPSGLACIGNLLDHLPRNEKVLWIDPEFRAGRLSQYPAVPSNTKVCLFTKFAEECKSFGAEGLKSFETLKNDFDPQKGCKLGLAGQMCQEITEKVMKTSADRLNCLKDWVNLLEFSEVEGCWRVETEGGFKFQSKMIFMTVGSHPKTLAIPGNLIDLDDALNPTILNQKINSNNCVAVYGSSHSAMLVLKNLLDSPSCPKLIINYYRQAAKFASFPDPVNAPDLILHDNTGLKGEVAEWVRSWVELDSEGINERFKGRLKRVINNKDSDADDVNDNNQIDNNVDFNIFAVGYERNQLPKIIYKSQSISNPNYTPTGQLTHNNIPIEGLFGFGIAFPERVKDLDGSDEVAVGLWKFMKHVKKSICAIL